MSDIVLGTGNTIAKNTSRTRCVSRKKDELIDDYNTENICYNESIRCAKGT